MATQLLVLITMVTVASGASCGTDNVCYCDVEEGGVFANCSHRNLTHIPALPANITALDLGFNIIDSLAPNVFVRFDRLQRLRLNGNTISSISTKAFSNLKNLKQLDLSQNKLNLTTSVFSRNLFEPLTTLAVLWLQGNVDTNASWSRGCKYPDVALQRLASLRRLHLDGLTNKTLGPGFQKLNLTELSLSGLQGSCNLHKLSDEIFQHLKNVQTLNISSCNILAVSKGAFTRMRSLTVLDISYNEELGFRPLRNISFGLQFTNIRVVNVSKLHRTFGLTTELMKEDIEYFRNTTVSEVHFDSNRLGLFETNLFFYFPKTIRVLSTQDNQFTYGPYLLQVGCLEGAEKFYGNYQNLAHSVNWPNLDTLTNQPQSGSIESTESTESHCVFYNASRKPLVLDLRLPQSMTEIHFKDSGLRYKLGAMYLPKNNVKYVDMSGNDFSVWEGPIGNADTVEYLDLSRTYCSYISKVFFQSATHLQTLMVSENYIGFVLEKDEEGEIFGHLKKLKKLDISINKIVHIPKRALSNLSNLEVLNISYNSLLSFDVDLTRMCSISTLDLQQNRLKTLSAETTSHLEKVSAAAKGIGGHVTVNLKENPLDCTCSNLEFLQWMQSTSVKLDGFKNYSCVDSGQKPVAMSDFSDHVAELEKVCPKYVWVTVISTVAITGFLGVVLVGLLYRYRWRLRYLYYMTKSRFYGYSAIPSLQPEENYKHDAFISFASEDLAFIKREIVVKLETAHNLSLCIHQRDFLPGKAIADNIVDSIQSSRKTVVVLTRNYLESYWCMFEFNMARMEGIYHRDGKSTLFLIMLEDIPTRDLPLELLELVQSRSYIEYPDEEPDGHVVFWRMVREAILH